MEFLLSNVGWVMTALMSVGVALVVWVNLP